MTNRQRLTILQITGVRGRPDWGRDLVDDGEQSGCARASKCGGCRVEPVRTLETELCRSAALHGDKILGATRRI